jgi:ribosomal protein S20
MPTASSLQDPCCCHKEESLSAKELLVMERQQTSKRDAAQNEAFQAAFGREDNVADTLARRSVFHDEDADREGRAIAQTEACL